MKDKSWLFKWQSQKTWLPLRNMHAYVSNPKCLMLSIIIPFLNRLNSYHFLIYWQLKALYSTGKHSPIHTRMAVAFIQNANLLIKHKHTVHTYTHTHTHRLHFERWDLGPGILTGDIYKLKGQGIKPVNSLRHIRGENHKYS